tara:strand:- start:738 stop:1328 length:591 start_codon:yes stop_codon:yes gene_type:complete
MKIKNLILFVFFLIFSFNHVALPKEPGKFIEEITSEASSILASEDNKEDKILKLKKIAENSVDIIGIGLYSLGKHRKTINSDQKKTYNKLFREYFLKSFSNRLVDYSDPKIEIQSEEKVSDKYTIVRSLLVATDKRPEVKLDWRVYTKDPNNPLIRDLVIEGLSLARTQKEEFNSIIVSNNNNLDALFNNLREFTK